jgi:hypothetical protein
MHIRKTMGGGGGGGVGGGGGGEGEPGNIKFSGNI